MWKRGGRIDQPAVLHGDPDPVRWPSGRGGGRESFTGPRRLGPVGSRESSLGDSTPDSGGIALGSRRARSKRGLSPGGAGPWLWFFPWSYRSIRVSPSKRSERWRFGPPRSRRCLSWACGSIFSSSLRGSSPSSGSGESPLEARSDPRWRARGGGGGSRCGKALVPASLVYGSRGSRSSQRGVFTPFQRSSLWR